MLSQFFNRVVYKFLKNFNPLLCNLVTDRIWNRDLNLKDIPNKVSALISAASAAKSIGTLPIGERRGMKPLLRQFR